MKYYEYIPLLEKAKGSNAKLEILKEAMQNPYFEEYVKEIFNPYFNTYIRKLDPTATRGVPFDPNYLQWPNFIRFLRDNTKRTKEAQMTLSNIIADANDEEQVALKKFINRDMRCGVNRGLVKKINKDLIPEFPIGLAAGWNEKKLQFPAWIDPKLDGIRCLAFVENGEVTWMSRNGKPLDMDIEFSDDIKYIADGIDFVFDGELMGTDFQQLMTQVQRKTSKDQSKLVFHIFDGMPRANWMDQKSRNYVNRKLLLEGMFAGADVTKLKLVEGFQVDDEEQMHDLYNHFVAQGYEGCIIKQDAPYNFKRTYNWMKLKPVETYDGVIVDVLIGEKGKQFENSLGALLVEIDGVTTQVGSGYTIEYRDELWKNKKGIIGKMVEVAGDCLTNDGRVRFPRFVQFRPDKD